MLPKFIFMETDFILPMLIRESHLDTFGHVNNATYLQIFEDARWELISSKGYDLNYVKKTQKGPIILEINLKYLREIHLREKISVTVKLLEYKKRIGVLEQKVLKENGEVACQAKFVFGLFDMVNRKLISATPEWMAAINPGATI
jgi:acyl-CoA thioester hydrolase